MHWKWLTAPEQDYTWVFIIRVVVKALVLFGVVNALYAVVQPLPEINRLTLHNTVLSARERLPYADNPDEAFNLSLTQVDGMFAVHEIAGSGSVDDEFRVAVMGDSAVWGWLLESDETLSACLTNGDFVAADGRPVVAYNFGYPITNATKDLMLLDYALRYNFDAVLWLVTLEAVYNDNQLDHPIVLDNRARVLDLIAAYDIALDTSNLEPEASFWEQTVVGQRRQIADWLRLQMYSLAWAVSGFDHTNPRFFRAPVVNFPDSDGVPNRPQVAPGNFEDLLAFDVIDAGVRHAASVGAPVLLVNEPIFIGDGANSDLRYNELYPRWAYDIYRARLGDLAQERGWQYLDLWNFVPPNHFTDYFPLHIDAEWTCRVAEAVAPMLANLPPFD